MKNYQTENSRAEKLYPSERTNDNFCKGDCPQIPFPLPPNGSRSTERLFPIRHLRDRHHRKRGEDAGAGVHFQGHGAE